MDIHEAAAPHSPICPFCLSPMGGDEGLVVCADCKTSHHFDCWEENRGCATYGCGCDRVTQHTWRASGYTDIAPDRTVSGNIGETIQELEQRVSPRSQASVGLRYQSPRLSTATIIARLAAWSWGLASSIIRAIIEAIVFAFGILGCIIFSILLYGGAWVVMMAVTYLMVLAFLLVELVIQAAPGLLGYAPQAAAAVALVAFCWALFVLIARYRKRKGGRHPRSAPSGQEAP